MTQAPTSPPSGLSGIRYLGANLSPGVSAPNASSMYLLAMVGILLSTFTPQMQPYLLSEFLAIPESEQGRISGQLSFWGEVAIIASVGFWGSLSDKIGRRTVSALGFLIMGIGVALYPLADSVTGLFVGRIVFGVGVAAFSVMIGALLADYVCNDSRGKATGYQGICNGLGAITTVFLLLQLPRIFQAQGMDAREAGFSTYYLVVGISLLTALVMWLGLQRKEVADKYQTHAAEHEHGESLLAIARKGLHAARDPGIALAYGAAFISRGNLAVVGTFFTLWLANYGTLELGMTRAEALAKAGMIVGICQGSTLLGAPLFGILADKLHRVSALTITLVVSAIGYSATYFIDNPFGPAMIACAVVIGLGEVGCIITSGVLIAQQSPARLRGAVIGFFNLSGAVGIMAASILGGYLFDAWKPQAPFVIFGVLASIVSVWAVIVRRRVVAPPDTDG